MVRLDRRDGALRAWGRVSGVRTAMVDSFLITQVEATFGVAQQQLEFQLTDGFSDDPVDLTAALLPTTGNQNIPLRTNLQFVAPPNGVHMTWDASASSKLYVTMAARKVSIDNLQLTLPPKAKICFGGGRFNCDPHSSITFSGVPVELPNRITVNGHICLQEGTEGVYGNCPSSDKFVLLQNVQLKTARLEVGMETDTDAFPDDDYLKLHLDTDSYGIKATGIRVKTGKDVTLRVPQAVRNLTVGEPFTGVSRLGGKVTDAASKYRSGQMKCDGLSIEYHSSVGDFSARDKVIPSEWCA
jgi:hypothetical protein